MPDFRWGPTGATYSTGARNPPPEEKIAGEKIKPREVKLRARSRGKPQDQEAVMLAVASLTDALKTMASKNYVKPDWSTLSISYARFEFVAEVECRTSTIHRTPGGVWTA